MVKKAETESPEPSKMDEFLAELRVGHIPDMKNTSGLDWEKFAQTLSEEIDKDEKYPGVLLVL